MDTSTEQVVARMNERLAPKIAAQPVEEVYVRNLRKHDKSFVHEVRAAHGTSELLSTHASESMARAWARGQGFTVVAIHDFSEDGFVQIQGVMDREVAIPAAGERA